MRHDADPVLKEDGKEDLNGFLAITHSASGQSEW
jgi:hypothetical protein